MCATTAAVAAGMTNMLRTFGKRASIGRYLCSAGPICTRCTSGSKAAKGVLVAAGAILAIRAGAAAVFWPLSFCVPDPHRHGVAAAGHGSTHPVLTIIYGSLQGLCRR